MNFVMDKDIKNYMLGLLYVIIISVLIVPFACFICDRFLPNISIPLKQSCFYSLAMLVAIISARLAIIK